MTTISPALLTQLSDRDLLARIHLAVKAERQATAQVVALLMELDTRRLYLGEGCPSLFAYCTQVLHFSEHAAFNRIEAARAARRYPVIFDLLAEGAVTLTAVRLLAPHFTPENHREVLDRARHKKKRDLELLVASLSPRPDVAATVRKLPTCSVGTSREAATEETRVDTPMSPPVISAAARERHMRTAEIKPLTPERLKVQFTVSRETHDKLRRAQDLLRHAVPDGDPGLIFERALVLLLAELERSKTGATKRPRAPRGANPTSRHIPAAVKRIVWQRDGGQCAFKGAHGRCAATGFLEYHHVVPFAVGGETSPRNIELRCRAHNQYEADQYFGTPQDYLLRERPAWYRTKPFRNELRV